MNLTQMEGEVAGDDGFDAKEHNACISNELEWYLKG